MIHKKNNEIQLPEAIIDLLVEDIIESSDEDILEEARKKYKNPSLETERLRGLVAQASIKAKKAGLTSAKKEMDAHRQASSRNQILDFSLDAKKSLLQKAKVHVPSLTLAARNGEEMTEHDTNCLLQDLIDLGVIDENGNFK